MKNAIVRGLIGSAVTLLVAMAFVLALQGYKVLVPAQVEHNTSNITQADYDQAFAKWDGQNISTYEFTVVAPKQELRMRVDRNTGDIYLLSHTVLGLSRSVDGLKVPLSGVALRTFQVYTPDAIYNSIQEDMVNTERETAQPGENATTRYIDLNVQFDPALGYPAHVTESVRTTLDTKEITWRTNANDLEIKDFTAIQ